MKEENIIRIKSFALAKGIVLLYMYLTKEKKEYVLSKQLLRCGTSVGANIEEGIGGQSRKDFYFKFSIAYKEARETFFWIRLLRETGFLDSQRADPLIHECEEVLKIIGSILKTLKQTLITNNS